MYNNLRSPKLAFQVTVRLTRRVKHKGRRTKDIVKIVTAHNYAEAEVMVTTALLHRASFMKKFTKLEVIDRRVHDSDAKLSAKTLNAADRMLGLVAQRIHREIFS